MADVGGDAGQFIPPQITSAAYVVEASDRAPVPGVLRVPTLAELPDEVDLVLCAHVLEHLPHPLDLLRELSSCSHLAPGALIYLEVPLERPKIVGPTNSSCYARYLDSLTQMPAASMLVDFASVIARSSLGLIAPPLMLKMHEHVNFFTVASCVWLARRAELEVLCVSEEAGSGLMTHQGVIRMLARTARGTS